MALDRTPLVNGQAYAWVDIIVEILGVPLAGITAVTYDETGNIVNNYGAGRRPVSRGHGKIETTCSISIDRAEYNSLVAAAPNSNLMDIPEFDITVAYVPDGSAPTADIIKNCRFIKNAGGASEGDTNVVVDLDIVCSHVDWNAVI